MILKKIFSPVKGKSTGWKNIKQLSSFNASRGLETA
jgi:hypothetical protein